MKYLIHSCNNRKWYVDEYLIPSMIEQGISKEDIHVYNDDNCEGNLVSFVKSCDKIVRDTGIDEQVWHLQDDVLICSKFKQLTETLGKEDNIICGFISVYDEDVRPGVGKVRDGMWWSFPCIKIPNKITRKFVDWTNTYVWRDNQFAKWIQEKKYDDALFKVYITNYHPDCEVVHVAPTLVEHVDYLIGGSEINEQRKKSGVLNVRSLFWEDEYLVEELADKLRRRKKQCGTS